MNSKHIQIKVRNGGKWEKKKWNFYWSIWVSWQIASWSIFKSQSFSLPFLQSKGSSKRNCIFDPKLLQNNFYSNYQLKGFFFFFLFLAQIFVGPFVVVQTYHCILMKLLPNSMLRCVFFFPITNNEKWHIKLESLDFMVCKILWMQVHHDMKAPLAHYFLYTGHNSYLTGNQLSSDCSEEPIVKALKRGVRVIELDLWPNSTRDGVDVRHGG